MGFPKQINEATALTTTIPNGMGLVPHRPQVFENPGGQTDPQLACPQKKIHLKRMRRHLRNQSGVSRQMQSPARKRQLSHQSLHIKETERSTQSTTSMRAWMTCRWRAKLLPQKRFQSNTISIIPTFLEKSYFQSIWFSALDFSLFFNTHN